MSRKPEECSRRKKTMNTNLIRDCLQRKLNLLAAKAQTAQTVAEINWVQHQLSNLN
jgi:hypothetical protein